MCSHGDCSFTMEQDAHNDRRALHESVLSLLGPIFEGARATAHDLLSPPLLSRLQQLQLHMAVVDAAWKPLAMLSDALQLQRVMLSPTNAIMIPLYEQYGTQTVTAALPFHDRRRPFPTPEAAASADSCVSKYHWHVSGCARQQSICLQGRSVQSRPRHPRGCCCSQQAGADCMQGSLVPTHGYQDHTAPVG